MFGRIHEWPLRPSILLSMPFDVMARATRDLFMKARHDGESFEADVLSRYGQTLYEIFFKPYTQKFLFHDPRVLHRDWARAGVNRAVIDKRASADSLFSLLKTTLLPRPVETTFLYAAHGVGRLADRLAEIVQEHGGRIVLGASVEAVERSDQAIDAVHAGGERFPCRRIVWTAPITLLDRLLGIEDVDLQFLSTIFYNLEIARPVRASYQWTYFGGDEIFSRVTSPAAFAETTVPAGKGALCVELTCRQGDERWQHPGRYTAPIVDDLVRTGVIDSPSDVEWVHVEPVPDTYPIYRIDYADQLKRNLQALGRYRNLLMAGRCGRFWYNNMDHSIGQGLTMADGIVRGDVLHQIDAGQREFWEM
jgi:protoporphyrinogen oxidase